jgi:hypothetical protein
LCQQTVDKRSKNQKEKVYEAKDRVTKEASIKMKKYIKKQAIKRNQKTVDKSMKNQTNISIKKEK